jgi:transketolase
MNQHMEYNHQELNNKISSMQTDNKKKYDYKKLAAGIISIGIDAVEQAKSGHPGAILGMSDFITVLFAKHLRFSAKNPHWAQRDRFILSNGHASMLLYSILYLTGYERPTIDDIKKFRQLGSVTAGHPEYGHLNGVEVTTGPLGQGFANSVGMAIAQKKANHTESKIYVAMGDGCMMEGISHEAASLAGHLGLNNLIALFDSNQISIDGSTDLADSTNTKKRFESYGWKVIEADGHDYNEIEKSYEDALSEINKPTLIIFNTVIAKHANKKRGSASSHGAPLGSEELNYVKEQIDYQDYQPFEIPAKTLSDWREIGSKYDSIAVENQKMFELSDEAKKQLEIIKTEAFNYGKEESTRKSSGNFLEKIVPFAPEIIGGSADLSESNCAITKESKAITKNDFSGNYIHYGIREHAMVAITNGLACYGNFLPYGSSFLIFSDYAKPSVRLSALMNLHVVQIFTHDSIGLGEDGPTHQPIEQLAGLRSIPNLLVFRPADVFETTCAWNFALTNKRPSIIVCSRQNLPQIPKIRSQSEIEQDIYRGAYIVKDYRNSDAKTKINLISTGSELHLALDIANELEKTSSDISLRVVSVVCSDLLDEHEGFIKEIFDENAQLRVIIEAGCSFGWHKYLNKNDLFCGLDNHFGASGKASDLYKHFGLDKKTITKKITDKITMDS